MGFSLNCVFAFMIFFFFYSEIRANQHIAFCGQRCQKGKVMINHLCNGLVFEVIKMSSNMPCIFL